MEECAWRKIRLSLEKPYIQCGENIDHAFPILLDITPEGEYTYEPKKNPATKLGENFIRIFMERGIEVFDQFANTGRGHDLINRVSNMDNIESSFKENNPSESLIPDQRRMIQETLLKMRSEFIPQLHIAMGEMSFARDLLSLLLLPPVSAQSPHHISLTSSTVAKPTDQLSVDAFNLQLVLCGTDDALHNASYIFRIAAEKTHRGLERDELFWADALQIRRRSWGLVPAPLPLGSVTGKGGDKLSKDFLLLFGLENSSAYWLRNAVGYLQNKSKSSSNVSVLIPFRRRFRLRVSIANYDRVNMNLFQHYIDQQEFKDFDDHIKIAQREIVEQEIFSELIRLVGTVGTVPIHVSERLIKIEAAQGVNLEFEMVEEHYFMQNQPTSSLSKHNYLCDLIHAALHIFLVCTHAQTKTRRLKLIQGVSLTKSALLLQTIIDLIQYQVFCARIYEEFYRLVRALRQISIPTLLQFQPVGDCGEYLVKSLVDEQRCHISGEAILRIEERQTLRFTFISPSSLTAHVPKATVLIMSIPQLSQLLIDEVERALLKWICEVGAELCHDINGTWFVDRMMHRSVGRWDGCILHFRVNCSSDFSVTCTTYMFERNENHNSRKILIYGKQEQGILLWIKNVINSALP